MNRKQRYMAEEVQEFDISIRGVLRYELQIHITLNVVLLWYYSHTHTHTRLEPCHPLDISFIVLNECILHRICMRKFINYTIFFVRSVPDHTLEYNEEIIMMTCRVTRVWKIVMPCIFKWLNANFCDLVR